ncbi:acetylxylan esterase [Agriterribacter sp.]|uniref:alpha/beta hydrolase n=1 Tax=Agriterribacter sp. TaxID=2821509 RepID=UPI002CCAE130|nr:acetylxylan esterase [Agriterribacter sp.]HRO44795.1 acetylxylan esterase [Agriterribacter sp.]HRQ18120.1 acetylxylan esterase [Agriterribacter sp.]
MIKLNNYAVSFKIICILLFATVLVNNKVHAQNEYDVIRNNWIRFSDAPNALYHHFAQQAYTLLDKRAAAIKGIHSLKVWHNRQQYIRKSLQDLAGPFPQKTALNAKTVRTINKEGYRIEHVIYESQPGFFVTSSLYIPTIEKKNKLPAIIYCSGHAGEGYRSTVYQHVILNLVKKGFIVFAFDPVGQGERLEYFDAATGKSTVGGPVDEHSYAGAQAIIAGSSQAKYMIWDGIRAVDYLLTRKEVDAQQIGITGRSGGGTQSAYIAAFDDRIKAAAPECYITNLTRIFQSIGPQDAEQNLSAALVREIDHADLLLARAPKPTLMITTTRDIFSIEGARETAKEVSRIYKAYNKEDNFNMMEDDAPHASTKKNREAMYAFFQKHLNNPGNPNDDETDTLTAQELQVTETGQIATSLKSETVFSLNRKHAEQLEQQLKTSRNALSSHLVNAVQTARKLSGYAPPLQNYEPVFTGRFQRDGYVIEKYFLQGEGNYIIPYLLLKPDKLNHKALLYLHPSGKQAEAAEGGEMEWFVKKGFTVLAPDLIGVGEMGSGIFEGDSFIKDVSYNVWFASMLIGRSIVGVRAGNVVSLARLLQRNENVQTIYGLAKKEMAPVLLHAAAFDSSISSVALIEPYTSYRAVVMHRFYTPAFIHSTVPNALTAYDLPDLAAGIAPRKLVIAHATDGAGNESPGETEKDFAVIKAAYHYKNADRQLRIVEGKPTGKNIDLYLEWIE